MDPDRGDLRPHPRPASARHAAGMAVLLVCLCWTPAAVAGYRSMVVTVTAYNGVPAQTSKHPRKGAWGDKLDGSRHAVAVSRDLLSQGLTQGTKVKVEGFDEPFVVLDKMAAGKKQTVDIYMGQAVGKAREFGRQRLRIWWYEK